MKLEPSFSPCTKSNPKRIKDFSVKWKTLKLLEGMKKNKLVNISLGRDVLNRTPVEQKIASRTNKWECMKWKLFYIKESFEMEDLEWGKSFVVYTSDMTISYKWEIKQQANTANPPINRWANATVFISHQVTKYQSHFEIPPHPVKICYCCHFGLCLMDW